MKQGEILKVRLDGTLRKLQLGTLRGLDPISVKAEMMVEIFRQGLKQQIVPGAMLRNMLKK